MLAHLQGELCSHDGAQKNGRPQQLVHGKPDKSACGTAHFVSSHALELDATPLARPLEGAAFGGRAKVAGLPIKAP